MRDRLNSLEGSELISGMSAHAWLVLEERGAPLLMGVSFLF